VIRVVGVGSLADARLFSSCLWYRRIMSIRGVVVAGIIASWGAGNAAVAIADGSNAGWVTLKVSRVQVKPRKIDGTTWDLSGEKRSGDCGLVGIIGKAVAGPVAGSVATFLCSQSSQTQQGRDASAPDLFVQVVAGDAKYRTPIAADTFAEAFDFPVIVPIDGIPAAGLQIQVLDQDQDVGAGELIGMVRVTRRQLQDALSADVPLLTLSDGQLDKIEIEVSQYSAPALMKPLTFNADREPVATPLRVRAGELVTIRARGKYSVAGDRRQLDENGYTGGEKRGYNRKPDFDKANHATAIAYIGAPKESHTSVVIGSCVATVAPIGGQLHVGINDESVGNNQGSLVFEAQATTPTVEQWRSGGAFACPGRPVQVPAEAPPPIVEVSGVPESLDRAMISESVMKVKADVSACGSRSIAKGAVKVFVTVGASGGITDLSIMGTPDAALGDCVAAAMKKAVFPPTKNGGSFSYPFVF
jgi:hypothetical protein